MIKKAHKVGAKFLVDAAQAAAHIPITVTQLNPDFLSLSGHKMFGPMGIGILYGREDLLNAMPPYQGGGGMIDTVSFKETRYHDLPHKFEAGTPDVAAAIALKEAVKYIQETGFSTIDKREKELLNHATENLKTIPGLKIIGQAPSKSAVISFVIDGIHSHDLAVLLDRQGIAIRSGHHCTWPLMERMKVTSTARISFSLYNTKEEIGQFIKALKKSRELLQ